MEILHTINPHNVRDKGAQRRVDPFLLYLTEQQALEPGQTDVLEAEQASTGKAYAQLCLEMGFLEPQALTQHLATFRGVKTVALAHQVLDREVVRFVERELCYETCCIPMASEPGKVGIAIADIGDIEKQDRIRSVFPNRRVEFFLAPRHEILEALEKYHPRTPHLEPLLKDMGAFTQKVKKTDATPHPVVDFVEHLLKEAVKRNVSDIHLEPEAFFVRVRYRIDGLLTPFLCVHKKQWEAISTRLKIMAGMNIAELRRPQGGHFRETCMGREIDFRVATHPTAHGENIAVRVLDRKRFMHNIEALGYTASVLSKMKRAVTRPEGMVLLTGPTGAGKTTSLYALTKLLATESTNVMTLEDPIEYQIGAFRQTEVREDIGFGFPEGIRSLLRQDPDVLLIGEIRDNCTAKMALRAAMTGRLVLTSMHAPDVLSTLDRLSELGVSAQDLGRYLNCIVSQRLVRVLCPNCKQEVTNGPPPFTEYTIYEAVGCEACLDTGYQGRVALAEVMTCNALVKDTLCESRVHRKMGEVLRKQNFQSMREDAHARVIAGQTSLSEVTRILGEEDL